MRSARITPVELLAIVAVIGIPAALLVPSVGGRPPLTDEDLATELDEWRPEPEHQNVPLETLRIRDADLAGVWADRISWLSMDIQPLSDGRYSVSFRSRARCGHSGSVQLKRTARYEDGVILLDRPVRELSGTTYERLYSVRIEDAFCLLPSVRVAEVQADTLEIPYRGVLARTIRQ